MHELPRDLGDGLLLRRSRPADREKVAEFHANTLLDIGEEPPLERLYVWILDLLSGTHPTFAPDDFTIVEEAATGKIVSSMALISQTWTYDGIPFAFGQPDIVSTDPAYRRRGLVRAQMEVIHGWGAERGELVQGITGIPWYYRQFGYEMALSLGGNRVAYRANVPALEEGKEEPYTFRPAATDDLPFIMAMVDQEASRSLVAAPRDEVFWRFDLFGRSDRSGAAKEVCVIERQGQGGVPAGALIHARRLWGSDLGVRLFEVEPGEPLLGPTPSVMRYLDSVGEAYAKRDGGHFTGICFDFGEEHPLYDTVPERLPKIGRPYAWYIRVPDLAAFMSRIAPALEARLAESPQSGYSGDVTISLYRNGIRLRIVEGRIAVERWKPERVEDGNAAFPNLTFLQLLFGFRSLPELQHAFPDCLVATDDARALLPVLFPKRASSVRSGG